MLCFKARTREAQLVLASKMLKPCFTNRQYAHMVINNSITLSILLTCIIGITIIDTLLVLLFDKLGLNTNWLFIPSLISYLALGYFVSIHGNVHTAITYAIVIGLYEGTIGFWLSERLSKKKLTKREKKELSLPFRIVSMVIYTVIVSTIGYALTYI